MKTLFFFLLTLSGIVYSQAPEGINYQMVVRNFSNQLVTNSNLAIQVQIRQTSATGPLVYQERHVVTTNVQGLVNIVIGNGTVQSGTFSTISWGNGPYFAVFGIDFSGGTTYQNYGSQQLMSVPYALYAKSAGATLNQWQYGTGVPAGSLGVAGNYYYDTNNGNIYYKQNGTTWILAGNIMGPAGATGPQGSAGPTGAQGPQGIPGTAGATGATGTQGAQGAQGPAGTNGINGTNGYNTLVATTTVSAGVQCPTGGVKLEYGLDINNNGLLDATEITSSLTKYVCNGSVGATGATGPQGPIGLTGPAGATGATGPQGPIGLTGPAGATGPQGPAGTNGTNGINGTNGTAVLNGTTVPTSAVGANGDFFINTATNTLYGPKANGIWPAGTSLVGPAGATGATGATGPQGPIGLTGPAGATGPQGPIGLTGAAGPQGPIGLTGPAGTNGTNGINGTNGTAVLNGTTVPTSAVGANGDFFINTATNTLYGPKTNGTWPAGTTLVGPAGATGATGPQGPIGLTGPAGATGATGPLVSGTTNQTLRNNGSTWESSSMLTNTSQSIGINTISPNASAILDIQSTNKGILLPTMTQAQRNSISNPAIGLLIFQTDGTLGFYFYNGSSWVLVGGSSNNSSSSGSSSNTLIYTTDGF